MENKEKKIELLKCKNGNFDNLYIRIDGGYPVQIKLAFFNGKVMRFLLASALPFKIERNIKLAECEPQNVENPLADDDGVIEEVL